MRKFLLLIIILNLLFINTSFAKEIEYLKFKPSNYEKPKNFDAFVWHEGDKLKLIKGKKFSNEKNLPHNISIYFNCSGCIGNRIFK